MEKLITIFQILIPTVVFPFLYLAYLIRQKSKLLKFKNIFSENEVIQKYYENFIESKDEFNINRLFSSINFTKREYFFPLLLLFIVSTVCAVTIYYSYHDATELDFLNLIKINNTVAFALAGAFIWGISDIIERIRNLDLTPYSLNLIWVRILISGSLGFIISVMDNINYDAIKYLCAFGIGAFPISTTKYYIKRIANKWLKIGIQINEDSSNFEYINGINPATKSRLIEENINCAENLAFTDPVLLHLRTNIEWKVIIDLIDQSLLKIYVDEKIAHLRKLGIRGAIEASNLYEDYCEDSCKCSSKTIDELSVILEIDQECVVYLLMTIHGDLFIRFIRELWQTTVSHDITDHQRKSPGPNKG